jgi:hypothetical protein
MELCGIDRRDAREVGGVLGKLKALCLPGLISIWPPSGIGERGKGRRGIGLGLCLVGLTW